MSGPLIEAADVGLGVESSAVKDMFEEFAGQGRREGSAFRAKAVEEVQAGLVGMCAEQRACVAGTGADAGEMFLYFRLVPAGGHTVEPVEKLSCAGLGRSFGSIGLVVGGANAEAAVGIGQQPFLVVDEFCGQVQRVAEAEQGFAFCGAKGKVPKPGILRQGGTLAEDDTLVGLALIVPTAVLGGELLMIEFLVQKSALCRVVLTEGMNEWRQIQVGGSMDAEAAVRVMDGGRVCAG